MDSNDHCEGKPNCTLAIEFKEIIMTTVLASLKRTVFFTLIYHQSITIILLLLVLMMNCYILASISFLLKQSMCHNKTEKLGVFRWACICTWPHDSLLCSCFPHIKVHMKTLRQGRGLVIDSLEVKPKVMNLSHIC